MLAYRTNDGARVTGATSREVAKALRAQSRSISNSFPHWMEETAARVQLQTGLVISTETEGAFIAGLVEAGLLKPDPAE